MLAALLTFLSSLDARALAAALSAAGGLVTAAAKMFRLWRDYRTRRRIQRSLGLTLFDEDSIRRAAKYYLRQDCCREDPGDDSEMRQSSASREDLFSFVDAFLERGTPARHLILLGDSGTGKSSFVLNYAAYSHRKRKKQAIVAVPLCDRRSDQFIAEVANKRNAVIFLDGFDEDPLAIDDATKRFRQLMQACADFPRVIVTCRSQFFLSEEDIPTATGLVRIGPRALAELGVLELSKIYIAPFSQAQTRKYFGLRYPIWRLRRRMRAIKLANKIPLLSARPMLLTHIDDIVDSGEQISEACELYGSMVDGWLNREASAAIRPNWSIVADGGSVDTSIQKQVLRSFTERFAVYVATNSIRYPAGSVPAVELAPLAAQWGVTLEDWQLRGRSLLNRDRAGNYKLAHRSIMEYLVAKRCLEGDESCMKLVLSAGVEEFIRQLVSVENFESSAMLSSGSRASSSQGLWYLTLSGRDLSCADLGGRDLSNKDLSFANLRGANLAGADLSRADLSGADMRDANLTAARLDHASLWQTILAGAAVHNASFLQARLWKADLSTVRGLTPTQLCAAETLFETRLDSGMLSAVRGQAPHLMARPGHSKLTRVDQV